MPDHSDSGGEEEKPISPAEGSHPYRDPGSPSNAQQSSDESGSSDGVLVELPGNPDQDSRRRRVDPDSGVLVNIDGSIQEPVDESGRDDAFEDASDQMAMEAARRAGLEESLAVIDIGESSGGGLVGDDLGKAQLQSRLEGVTAECRKYKEEREILGKEVVNLRRKLSDILDDPSLLATDKLESIGDEDPVLSSSTPLHTVLIDCSKLLVDLKTTLGERKNYAGIIDELNATLNAKDREIQDLNSKAPGSSSFKEESSDVAIKRLLESLGAVVGQEHASAEFSPADDLSLVEKKTLLLIENYRQFASETQQLKQVLSEIKSSSEELEDNELDKIFSIARQELLESKRKETYLQQQMTSLEEENRKFVEQIERMRESLEAANAETNKTKTELEQSENKLAAAKEKLSIAVTKGKSLVQHRDSLKHSLAERTSDLEKCMQELQQKTEALQAYGGNLEELKHLLSEKASEHDKCMQELQQKTEDLQAYEGNLQELKHLLSEKTSENEKCMQELQQKSEALQAYEGNLEELNHLLSEKASDHEKCMQDLQQKIEALQAYEGNLEELKNLLSEKTSENEKCTQDLQQKTEALLAYEGNLEELKNLLFEKTSEHEKCLEELQRTAKELEIAKSSVGDVDAANNLVNSLQESLSERDSTLRDIDEIMSEIGTPEEMLSNAIDKVKWLANQKNLADIIFLENRKIRDAMSSIELPENVLPRELDYQVNWLVGELTNAKGNMLRLQDEMNTAQLAVAPDQSEMSDLHMEIDRLESSLLEEKLAKEVICNELEDLKCKHEKAMQNLSALSADKAGLMKALLGLSESTFDDHISFDTSTIIEKCMININGRTKQSLIAVEHFEVMQKVLYLTDQELKLCEKILEDEVVDKSAMTRLSDELEKLSNEVIVLKNEKASIQKELQRSEEKCSLVKEKLSMAVKKGKGLVQEREGFKISLEEKESDIKNLKHAVELKDSIINECQEKINNLSDKTQQIEKLEVDIISLKDERDLSQQRLQESRFILENLVASIEKISIPTIHVHKDPLEKIDWIAEHLHKSEVAKISESQELDKVKEEASRQSVRLADAFATIKSLEDELSKASKHVSFVVEEKSAIQQDKVSIEQELEKIKEENSSQSTKLADAYNMIRSLEDALLTAEKDIVKLNTDKELLEAKSKAEIDELNNKLVECREEMERIHGSMENYSADISTQLGHLQVLIKDESLFSMMIEQFSKKIEGLKKINGFLQNIHNQFALKELNVHSSMEHEPALGKLSPLPKFEESAAEYEVVPSLSRIVGGLRSRSEFLMNNFEVSCKVLDEYIEVILQALQATTDKFINIVEHTKSLELDRRKLEAHNETQQANLVSLQKQLKTLFSACLDTTKELIEFSDSRDSSSTLEKDSFSGGTEEEDTGHYEKAAEDLFIAAKRIKSQYQHLTNAEKDWFTIIEDLKNKSREAELIAKNAVQELRLEQERVSLLEQDLGASKELCSQMKIKLESYQTKENTLRDKEEELSRSHMNALMDKVNKLNIPILDAGAQATEVHFSNPAEKLFFMVDKVVEMQQRIHILTVEKEDMQLTLESHVHEIESLRKEAEAININYEELEVKKNELYELTDGLERIIKSLGGYDALQDQKPLSAKLLLAVLDRLTTASSMEYENLKSRTHELGSKLQAKSNLIEELSEKVKILEGSIHARSLQQEITKGRTIIEATSTALGSEISENEDAGPSGKNTASSVPTAALLRTMRKGSSDHLALNIDSESDRLIASTDADAKGHVFKSLNTSGLIPKQGKSIADRVDGIWVAGGQILMRRPGARLGLIAYVLLMHLWLLGTIV